jgi:hypothetical protein
MGAAQLLDTMLNQEIEDSNFKDYYSDAPSRIAWLVLSSLFLGINLDFVIQTLQDDTNNNQILHSDRISAKKIWVTCTTAYTSHFLIQKSLATPITPENAVYILCSSAINGPLWGTLGTGAGYLLKKFNYNILPFAQSDIALIGLGIIISTLQEMLDYICKQMIDNDSLEWDSLVSPKRLFALHAYNSLLQGLMYGVSFCSARKYSRDELPENESVILKIRNGLLTTTILIAPISILIQQAMTVPINQNNAGYIIGDSFAIGIPYGLSTGCTAFTLLKLQLDYRRSHLTRQLASDRLYEHREPFLSRNHFLTDREPDQKIIEVNTEYAPPALEQIICKP